MDARATDPCVAGLISGEVWAFDAVYESYRPRLFGFLLRLTGQPEVAEELVQESFLRLARAAPRLRPDTRLAAWLFTVARNLALSWRRWRVLDQARLALDWILPLPAAPLQPAELAAGAELGVRLEEALAALPPDAREVLLLVGVEGFEPSEAAQILGISPEALRQRLSRARKALALRMGGAHDG